MEEITVFFAVDAEQYLISGFPQEAIDLCQRGLEAYPDYSAAYTVLARAYKALGEDDKAADILDKAAEKFSDKRLFEPAKRDLDFVPTFLENSSTKDDHQPAPISDQPASAAAEPDDILIDLETNSNALSGADDSIEYPDPDTEDDASFESFMNEALAEAAEKAETDAVSDVDSANADFYDLDSIAEVDSDLDAEDIDVADYAHREDEGQTEEALIEQFVDDATELPMDSDSSLAEEMATQRASNPEALDYIDEALAFNPNAVPSGNSELIDAEGALDQEVIGDIDSSDETTPDESSVAGSDLEIDEIDSPADENESEVEAEQISSDAEEMEIPETGILYENVVEDDEFADAAPEDDELYDVESLAETDETESDAIEPECNPDESGASSGGNFILRAVNLAQGEEDDSRDLRAGNLSLIPGLDFSPLKSGIRRTTHRPIGQDLDFPAFEIEAEDFEEPEVAMPEQTEVPTEQGSGGGFDFSELAAQLESVSIPKPRAAVAEENEEAHVSGFASETMAFIYEQQGAWEAALDSYQKLLAAKPERADFYIERIENIEGNIKLRGIDR